MIDNLIKKLPGGTGDSTTTDKIDPAQLSIGVQVEMEHTNDPEIAKEIESFNADYKGQKTAFIIMQFSKTKAWIFTGCFSLAIFSAVIAIFHTSFIGILNQLF